MALINRDTLRAKFNTIIVGTDENRDALLSVREAMKLIDLEPTVDAVEVVRCRDCRYTEGADENGWYTCRNNGCGYPANGYCSDGDRRGDNGREADPV